MRQEQEINIRRLTFNDRDEFNRKEIAEKLWKLLQRDDLKVSPVLLDGTWGIGKTEFCHKFKNYVRRQVREQNKTYKVLYMNTYFYDYYADPLIGLLERLCAQRKEEEKLRTIVGKVIFGSIRFGVSRAIPGCAGKVINAGIKGIETVVNEIGKTPENLKELKQYLQEKLEYKYIFIVDELDRCNPTFALKLIEVIKHIFDLPNFSFIVVANSESLIASVRHLYGRKIDGHRYLDKYFKLTVQLPERSLMQRETTASAYFSNWMHQSGHSNLVTLNYLIQVRNFSIRDVQKLIRLLQIHQLEECSDTFKQYILYLYVFHKKDLIRNLRVGHLPVIERVPIERKSKRFQSTITAVKYLRLFLNAKCDRNQLMNMNIVDKWTAVFPSYVTRNVFEKNNIDRFIEKIKKWIHSWMLIQ